MGVNRMPEGLARYREPETGAVAFGALDADGAAMELDDMFHYRQAQAGPAEVAGACFIDPIEPFEDARDVPFRYADPAVLDRHTS